LTSPAIASDALPNKRHGVRAANRREEAFEKDGPAYKRLRANGVQPRGIDGAAVVEQMANSVLEVEMGRSLGTAQDQRRAQEISSDLLGRDCTEEGKKIGVAKRDEVPA
jgi:hypothetical protein